MDYILSKFRRNTFFSPIAENTTLKTIFLANFFLSLHYFIIYYINSTFLSGFFSESQLSAIYIIGSIISTVVLLNASQIINAVSTYKITMYLIVLECIVTLGLAFSHTPFLTGVYFITHIVVISFLSLMFDIFIEKGSINEQATGSIRASFLTITNITVIGAALLGSLLVTDTYMYVYIVSSLCMIPLYLVFRKLSTLEEKKLPHINIKQTILLYIRKKNLYNIFACQFLLQFFYIFMGIYMPLYLQKYIGFSWAEIGGIFTIMLLPFVFFEIPVGNLADKKYGEKEFLTIGFIILGLSTLFISFITVKVFWIWATVLFITRIGASFVEITAESYFFKQVNQEDSDTISFFRITRPIASIAAPIVTTIGLAFIPYEYIFIIIGFAMILGAHYSLSLEDTM